MILQVRADALAVGDHVQPHVLEVRGGPDPRQHQDLRTAKGPRRQDHPAARVQCLTAAAAPDHDAGRAAIFDDDFFDQRAGAHREIPPPAQRLDIGARRRPALARLLRHLIEAETLIVRVVEIVGARQLQRRRALDETPTRHIGPALIHDMERAVGAVIFVGTALIAFAALEIGEHVGIAPPRRSE